MQAFKLWVGVSLQSCEGPVWALSFRAIRATCGSLTPPALMWVGRTMWGQVWNLLPCLHLVVCCCRVKLLPSSNIWQSVCFISLLSLDYVRSFPFSFFYLPTLDGSIIIFSHSEQQMVYFPQMSASPERLLFFDSVLIIFWNNCLNKSLNNNQ